MIEQQTRGEQLAALRKIKLDTFKHKGRKVSGAIQKATLRAIDDHQGRGDCFASQSTLADEVGCGTTAIGLAIAALIAQDLITADRPHRMAPNRHRVVWGSVFRLVGSSHQVEDLIETANHRDPPSVSRSPHSVDQSPALRVSSEPPSVSQRPAQRLQNAPSIATSNAPTNRPDNEAEVVLVGELYRWGLKSAAVAVAVATHRGWSIEFIRELFIEAGGNRDPQRWEPGQLANWLTGKTPPPFDEHEAAQRAAARIDGPAKREANEIRDSVRRDGQSRGVAEFIIEGLTFRKLTAVDLDRFATDAERAAAVRLDELDRERSEKPSHSVNARSGSAPSVIDEPQNRERASVGRTGRQTKDAGNQTHARTQNRGLFQRIPSGNRGTRAFDRKRAELVEALGGGS
ncbi:helix-turn-helix domain-containing protein [Rhodopirellula bahusiensis]|uniref:Uncharacterized protein n=1 Tax=Rhodopirellula bahusiensis TaxID=2014065 RepID=A0A2G1W9T9_9BACT|nr:hypothetical protein [Rhodopirellula bahusiensis]PHQ35804.1 hypothetical protein CEE69_09450 [Rhodopirellula bahusiensis]